MGTNYYYGHGKLLLTGEYFVLDGAKAIALPTKLGQRMHVNYRPSNNPKLYWKSYDQESKEWFSTSFELWHFNCLEIETPEVLVLKKLLQEARKLNIHFLREEFDVYVETILEFPINWGLGSSSTLIYNIAQWAYTSPFVLQNKAFEGSGYDIACAQSRGPISYQVSNKRPHWETVNFNPIFKENLYFVHLNKKQNSREGIKRYRDMNAISADSIQKINQISESILECIDLKEFDSLILEHELIISSTLDLPRIGKTHFSDFWGEVKSLGAWGGDFILATSELDEKTTKDYFKNKGYETVFSFDELILQNFQKYGKAHKDINLDRLQNALQ